MRAYLGRLGVWAAICASIPETVINKITTDPLRLALFIIGGSLFLCFGTVKEDK